MHFPPLFSRFPRLLVTAATGVLLIGCSSVNYYTQAVRGHMEVMGKARPIEEVLAEPDLPTGVRERLVLAQQVRAFLSERMHLPDNGSYREYSDLGRPYVVWNVVATDEFSVEPVRACFLLAGCFSYRGYFSEADAIAAAEELRGDGKDVQVSGATAYSTLGWFSDPLLNTLVERSEAALVSTLAHELAHQKLYVKGDSAFSEAFAVAVGQAAVERWYKETGKPEDYRAYVQGRERQRQFSRMLLDAREELAAIYASDIPPEEKRQAKTGVFTRLRQDYAALKNLWGGYDGYDEWMARDLNNAHLALVSTYNDLVPAFTNLLATHEGDLAAFFEDARQLAALPAGERQERVLALMNEAGPILASEPDTDSAPDPASG